MIKNLLFILSRIIIGVLFIFSGFVKAVDPIGSTIKFKDYLTAFHLESFAFVVFPLAFVLSTLEFLTGVNILINIKTKFFSYVALIFMCIFTPLTFVLALTNPVTDCGCFGDAVKLTNWETFFKNVVLLIPTVYLFIYKKRFQSSYSIQQQWMVTILFSVGILYVNYYSLNHLPALDFRPYKIGANINEGMTVPEGAPKPEYKTTFILEKDGAQKEFTAKNYPYDDSTWVFVDSQSELLSAGYVPPIHDFVLTNDEGEDVTQDILSEKNPTLLIVSYQIAQGNWDNYLDSIKKLQTALLNEGINTYCLTASTTEDITDFELGKNSCFNYLTADETMLKTTIRSNPGLILIQDGNVMGKWHYNDIPNSKDFKNPVSYALKSSAKKYNYLKLMSLILFFSLLTGILLWPKTEK